MKWCCEYHKLFVLKTDYPDQSDYKQNWHTRFKTEQKQIVPEKIETEGDTYVLCLFEKEIVLWFYELKY